MVKNVVKNVNFSQFFTKYCKRKTKISIYMINFTLKMQNFPGIWSKIASKIHFSSKLQRFPSKSKISWEWDSQIPFFPPWMVVLRLLISAHNAALQEIMQRTLSILRNKLCVIVSKTWRATIDMSCCAIPYSVT